MRINGVRIRSTVMNADQAHDDSGRTFRRWVSTFLGRTRVAALALAALAVVLPTLSLSSTAAAADESDPNRVVFVGIAGLAWPDVTAEDMPTLYDMTGSDAAASLTVRTVRPKTCVMDGWLTVSAGTRATDLDDVNDDGESDRFCREVPDTSTTNAGDTVVPGWNGLRQQQEDNSYNAEIGLLGDRLDQAGACATAVGPGAAVALADSTGRVDSYHDRASAADQELLGECPVTVLDLGGLPPPAPAGSEEPVAERADETRRQVARGIDGLLAGVIDELPPDTTLMVAGLSDSAATSVPLPEEPNPVPDAGLRVALAAGPELDGSTYGTDWLSSASTHWPGLVQLTDVAPTLVGYSGAEEPAEGFAGRPWASSTPHPATSESTITELVGVDRGAEIYRTQSGPFFQILGIGHLVMVVAAVLMLRKRGPTSRSAILRVVQVIALAAAAAPVASYLANLTRWWGRDEPSVVLWSSIVAFTLALTALALAGPWRRRVYGPPGVVAGVTATVLAIDVASGSSLQQSSLLGLSPLVAGRFYGFGNIPFAIFVVASLVAAGALGQWILDRWQSRRAAATAVAVVGVVAVVIDGAPQAGADVGGILAAIPGFTVLFLGALGAGVTVGRIVLAGVGATALFFLFAWLDWLRPPASRTHFGSFFADVLSGDALTVILRKAEASIGTLQRWPIYACLVPLGYVAIVWLFRTDRVAAVRSAVRQWSLLPFLVWSALLSGAVGFAANDSGIIIPALLLTVGLPLGVTAVAAASRAMPAVTPDREVADPAWR